MKSPEVGLGLEPRNTYLPNDPAYRAWRPHWSPPEPIKTGGKPTLRRNGINGNKYEAVWIFDGGGGVLEDNDLTGNERGAWDIKADCEPNVTRARNKK